MSVSSIARAFTAALALLCTTIPAHPQALYPQTVKARDDAKLVQPIYQSLPLGSIKPGGWLKDQIETEASGLAGNLFDFYRYVQDSMWIGGHTEYSPLHESAPYWFNGLVPLAFGLDDARLRGQVTAFVDYVLDHQQSDGWIGPETTPESRGLWARCYILLGLMQYAQADPSQADRIVDAMHRYVNLAHSMLQNNFTGLLPKANDSFDGDGFGPARAHEMHIPLQWLYERYPRNNSQVIWETMELMIEGSTVFGVDWRNFWVPGVYPEVTYTPREQPYTWLFNHGVNMAEGLRFPLSIYRMSHDEALRTQTRTALDLLSQWHKSLAGTIIGDEFVTDLNPSRGAELCTSTEMMFSTAYIYQYLGDNDLADWTELTAFNAFPGQLSPDWWSHQYVQQENQPWSRTLNEYPQMWQNVGVRGNVFGLEPNYPCCTVNHPQAYPKFLANSFVITEDGGIAHVLLSPGSVTAKGATILADTTYPFGMDLQYSITTETEFTFYVRIPAWASSSSTATGPSSDVSTQISPTDQGLQAFTVPKGESSVTVNLQAEPRVVTRANNSAAVYYGALLYTLAIDFNESAIQPWSWDGGSVLNSSDTTPQTHDHIIEPTSPWNIAFDPSQIKVVQANASTLPNPIWDYGAPPVELRVAAVEIDWPLKFDTPEDPPSEPLVTGKPFSARFVPFGSAKVHMAHLPVVQLPEVDLDAST
ncbi:Uu.00g037540.m01.CDS01 [Anthostomella pinea]|uniref:Uu.00g037540.m01.CDS01 n=1 Tax=Anthostomella pinea TaxID=933095 RepID=A0AAI8V9N5_9PEZI|nr:Uu.00g037540.m01.CDS01 [Anthostomella pinea]